MRMFKYEETAEMISVHEENVTDTCKYQNGA